MSSLLEAFPKHTLTREDFYEEIEVDCIAGMEWDLHLLVADQMVLYCGRLLTMDTKYPSLETARLVAALDDKKNLLQNLLDVQYRRWSSDIVSSYEQVKEVMTPPPSHRHSLTVTFALRAYFKRWSPRKARKPWR